MKRLEKGAKTLCGAVAIGFCTVKAEQTRPAMRNRVLPETPLAHPDARGGPATCFACAASRFGAKQADRKRALLTAGSDSLIEAADRRNVGQGRVVTIAGSGGRTPLDQRQSDPAVLCDAEAFQPLQASAPGEARNTPEDGHCVHARRPARRRRLCYPPAICAAAPARPDPAGRRQPLQRH
jgi:hypothetical protein